MEHSEICSSLEKRLYQLGCYTNLNEEYTINNKSGECDVFGINLENKKAYIIEVKKIDTPKHRRYAKHQLEKDIEYYSKLFKTLGKLDIYTFYAYSADKRRGYNVERIK